MRALDLGTNLLRGAALSLVAAYFFSVLFLLATGADVLAAFVISFGVVFLMLWFVLPAGVLAGFLVPEVAKIRRRPSRFLVAGVLGLVMGATGGFLTGRELENPNSSGWGSPLGPASLATAMALYAGVWCSGAVWLLSTRGGRRNV